MQETNSTPRESGASGYVPWTRRVRAAIEVKGITRLVFYALADRANADGLAWPGQTQITLDAGVSERTVREALRVLERFGYICREGSRHGADVWRMTVDEDGAATGDRHGAPPARGAGAAAGAAGTGRRTGTGRRKDRHGAPVQPARGADKDTRKDTREEPRESASGTEEANAATGSHADQLPDPIQRVTTNEPKPRRGLTGTSAMPPKATVDPTDAERIRNTIHSRIETLTGEPPPIPATDWRPLQMLVVAAKHDEAVALRAIDWLYTAADGAAWGGNEATFALGKGIRWALTQRADRMVEASAAWDRAGRPTRIGAALTGAPASVPPWDDMAPRLRDTHRGARTQHNPGGIVLAADSEEHARRVGAWQRIGGVRRWGQSTSDYERSQIRREWLAAYGGAP